MKKPVKLVRWHKGLTATVLLIVLLNLTSFLEIHQINRMEEEYCFDTLHEETKKLSKDIVTRVQSDRNQLEVIAAILAGYQDLGSQEVRNLLKTYKSNNLMSHLEILFPDNRVMLRDGTIVEPGNQMSFEKESEKGWHLTDAEPALAEADTLILRHYVPVTRNGETIAMLYGVIYLKDLPVMWETDAYDGEAAVYVIDGKTGDFIVDTWHKKLGSIWDLGKREMKRGYTQEQLTEGVINGDRSYVVFVSRTTGKYLYFYFEPMAINEWRIGLSVPEDIVFQNERRIKEVLRTFTVFEALCFVIYFLWMIQYVKKETNEKQRQLDMINYIYDVEKMLFTAHQKKENIGKALERIARMASADFTYFRVRIEGGDKLYLWDRKKAFRK